MEISNPYRGLPTYTNLRDSRILVDDRMHNNSADSGDCSTSETVSWWLGLETWNGILTGNWEGYNSVWQPDWDKNIQSINSQNRFNLIPFQKPQNIANDNDMTVSDVGINITSYTPEKSLLTDYPVLSANEPSNPPYSYSVGFDPLREGLSDAYKTQFSIDWQDDIWSYDVCLMHYHARILNNASQVLEEDAEFDIIDTNTVSDVSLRLYELVNNYGRGPSESIYQTLPFSAYDCSVPHETICNVDISNQDFSPYGPMSRDKFMNNPSADASLIHWHHLAIKEARLQNKEEDIENCKKNANMIASYLQYNTMDGYFHRTDNNQLSYEEGGPGSPYLGLLNTHFEWQSKSYLNTVDRTPPAIDTEYDGDGVYYIRRGSSDCHHAYQNLMMTHSVSTNETEVFYDPDTYLQRAHLRTLILLRYLQSPDGPIAGGVTNSYNGRYEIPADGRQNVRFFGLMYTYAPGKVNPPSNDWVGWQTTGHMSTSDFFLQAVKEADTAAVTMSEIVLDRLVKWFMDNVQLLSNNHFSVPVSLRWTSPTQVVGQTTTVPNDQGVFEYIPTLNIPAGTDPDTYGVNNTSFWNSAGVPNATLRCFITNSGEDVGIAVSLAYLLTTYAQAKRLLSKYDTPILGSPHTAAKACLLARELLGRLWSNNRDEIGLFSKETRTDYNRYFESDSQASGLNEIEITINSASYYIQEDVRFIDSRFSSVDDERYYDVEDYANGDRPAPEFTYHRFWHNAVFTMANGAMHHHFKDIIYSLD